MLRTRQKVDEEAVNARGGAGSGLSGLIHGNDGNGKAASAWATPAAEDGALEWWCLLRLSVPSCLPVCLEWCCTRSCMMLLSGVPIADPEAAAAAMHILIQTTSLLYIFPHSLSCILNTRVGHELGEGRPE
ncbi:protein DETOXIFICATION 50-like [Setaria italica]|uniref:protein DETOXIFICATION 50-like n=1 Tax=Setaria italica TaxID=4555 RepID=UPI0006460737|nr:protein DETOXIFICATION 50-like [Setaria italica]